MPADDRIDQLQKYLTDRFLQVSNEWAQQQIHDFSSNLNYEQIYRQVLEKDWNNESFKRNLKPTLPSELNLSLLNVEKKTFRGNYLLQIKHVVDISKPIGGHLSEIDKDDDDANEEGNEDDLANLFKRSTKIKPGAAKSFIGNGRRMLQLCLFDGYQQCLAIEYRPIACLNAKLNGAKIVITGPFDVYMGTILLRNQHVKIVSNVTFDIVSNPSSHPVQANNGNQLQQSNPPPNIDNLIIDLFDDDIDVIPID